MPAFTAIGMERAVERGMVGGTVRRTPCGDVSLRAAPGEAGIVPLLSPRTAGVDFESDGESWCGRVSLEGGDGSAGCSC